MTPPSLGIAIASSSRMLKSTSFRPILHLERYSPSPIARKFHSSTPKQQLKPTAALSVSSAQSKPGSKGLESSKTAFQQRQILDELRGAAAASPSSSSISKAESRPRFNATAEAALDATSGSGRGGGIPLGMAGLSVGGAGSLSGPSRIDKWTGAGKKWKDLKGGQKVARATVQSSRFTLILGGAAITFVLVYALTTELFAKNSPTVIFADACKKVQNHPAIKEHLLPPFRFRTSLSQTTSADFSPLNPPPASSRARRSRSVSSVSFTDAKTGNEILLLRFFIQAREKDHDLTLWDTTRQSVIDAGSWMRRKLLEGGEWIEEQLGWMEDQEGRQISVSETRGMVSPRAEEGGSSEPGVIGSTLSKAWNYSFGSLAGLAKGSTDALGRLTSSSTTGPGLRKREPGTWSTGEVHVEMVKDENGVLQYKHFFVDIPNSNALTRERVWIVRKQGQVER